MLLLRCIFASIITDQRQKSSWDGFYFVIVTVSGVTVSLHKLVDHMVALSMPAVQIAL